MKTKPASFLVLLVISCAYVVLIIVLGLHASDKGVFRYDLRAPFDWEKVKMHFILAYNVFWVGLLCLWVWSERPRLPPFTHVRGPF